MSAIIEAAYDTEITPKLIVEEYKVTDSELAHHVFESLENRGGKFLDGHRVYTGPVTYYKVWSDNEITSSSGISNSLKRSPDTYTFFIVTKKAS